MWPVLAAAAVLGAGKSYFFDRPAYNRRLRSEAETERYSYLTGKHGQVPENRPDAFGSALQFAGTAGNLYGGVKQGEYADAMGKLMLARATAENDWLTGKAPKGAQSPYGTNVIINNGNPYREALQGVRNNLIPPPSFQGENSWQWPSGPVTPQDVRNKLVPPPEFAPGGAAPSQNKAPAPQGEQSKNPYRKPSGTHDKPRNLYEQSMYESGYPDWRFPSWAHPGSGTYNPISGRFE